MRAGSKLRVGYLSSMEDLKGWADLLTVSQRVEYPLKEIEFHFYGGSGVGEDTDSIRSLFESCDGANKVYWHGAVSGSAKSKAFLGMDIFCLPSHTEAFPLVILEAMSYSLPIIASNVGAISDAVDSCRGGWLYRAGDRDDLKHVLEEALEQLDKWESMGEYNRSKFEEEYAMEKFSSRWHQFIVDVVN
ncbi:glycosyltransferase family 4 protein [Rubritalea tangerina]